MSGTTIVRIDPDDELPVILERLPSGEPTILVLPPQSRALSSLVGARLLARRAQSVGSNVVIVTGEYAVSAHVRAAGLQAAATVDDAEAMLDSLPPMLDDGLDDGGTLEDEASVPNRGRAGDQGTFGGGGGMPPFTQSTTFAPKPSVEARTHSTQSGVAWVRPGRAHDQPPRATDAVDTDVHPHLDPDPPEAGDDRYDAPLELDGGGELPPRGHSIRITAGRGVRPPEAERQPDDQRYDEPLEILDADILDPEPAEPLPSSSSGTYRRLAPMPSVREAGPAPRGLREAMREDGNLRPLLPWAIAAVLVLLLLWLLAGVVGGLLAPTATVTLTMRAGSVSGYTSVRAGLKLPLSKRDPAHIVMYRVGQPEHASVPVPVNGTEFIPGHVATGRIELANLTTAGPMVIPVGTLFTNAQGTVTFLTTRAVTVPPAHESFSATVHGTAIVPIHAAVGGSAGNVPAASISSLPSRFAASLIVTNTAPTTGGTDVPRRIVTAVDAAAAAHMLFATLDARARAAIDRRFGRSDPVEQHVLWIARSPAVPRLTPNRCCATLTLSIVMHAAYVHKRDLAAVARRSLDAGLSLVPDHPLIPDTVSWTAQWTPIGLRTDLIELSVSGRTSPPLDMVRLRRGLAGRTKAQADTYLTGLVRSGDVGSFTLSVLPNWASALPSDPNRIAVSTHPAR